MRPKLLIAILVLALSGANSGAASLCAAYCMSSASVGVAALHHHRMQPQRSPTSMSHHTHARHHGAPCAECPPELGDSLNQRSDCSSLGQVQALKEGSFSFEPSSGAAHIDIPNTPIEALASARGNERSIPFDSSHAIRNPHAASVPLRI